MDTGAREINTRAGRYIEMTQEAVVTLMSWGADSSHATQEKFSVYLAKQLADYYQPKNITITGKTMESMIEDWVLENDITEK